MLLEAGAGIDLANRPGRTALTAASETGHIEVVRLLPEAGAHIELADDVGSTALLMASYRGHSEVVCLLLDAGALIDFANIEGHHSSDRGIWRGPRWGRAFVA